MNITRLLALAAAATLLASACGGTSDSSVDSSADSGDRSAEQQGSVSVEPDEPASGGDTELISPTETDRPFDLNGGVAGSDADIAIVAGDPTENLDLGVLQATEPWPTDWSRQIVDPSDFVLGIAVIDPRDRIRPIDTPRFEPIGQVEWLDAREPGALVQLDGEARFYPLSILTRHEIVNDRFGDVPVAITYCPLCNTAIAFDRRVDGEVLRFGVSGLLRNSDMIMWDEGTTSLWQQITGEAVVGEFAGIQLQVVSTSIVSFGDVLESFPDAVSLSQDTGLGVNYGANPYQDYSSSSRPFLFTDEPDPRFPALSRVVGVTVGDTHKSYPFEVVTNERTINDEVNEVPLVIFWGGDTADALDSTDISQGAAIGTGIAFDRRVDGQILTFEAVGDDRFRDAETSSTWTLLGRAIDGPLEGQQLTVVSHRNEFWFAWASFFPDSDVYGES